MCVMIKTLSSWLAGYITILHLLIFRPFKCFGHSKVLTWRYFQLVALIMQLALVSPSSSAQSNSKVQQQSFSPVMRLADGSLLRGLERTAINEKVVTEFWGIPFAKPPTGNLRFR